MWLRDRPVMIAIAIVSGVAVVGLVIGLLLVVLKDELTPDYPDPGRPLSSFVPKTVTGTRNIPYGSEPRQKLDVWFPESTAAGATLPTIVWTHGGGWSAGSKEVVAPYLKVLADRGFTVVGINYSLAPGARYPTQVRELNAALGFLNVHAAELHVDQSRIVLAGDSGGAQISAQVAALTTNPTFASAVGIEPLLEPAQIVGVLLPSGSYDLEDAVDRIKGTARRYVDDYLGTTSNEKLLKLASVTPNVTGEFPPTWISSGNADPLTPQAKTFAKTLRDAGVEVDTLFFKKDHRPLIHEYQFALGLDEAQEALESMVSFAKKQTG